MVPLFAVYMPPKEILMPALEKVLYEPSPELGYVMIGQGPRVDEYEKKFGDWLGFKNVLALNSGTSALHIAYRLAGVKGGEVVISPLSCMASSLPAYMEGAKLVWADIDPITGMIDPKDVERKITPNTRAISFVHWGGSLAPLDELNAISLKYGIPLIEDAAHAMGAVYKNKRVGAQTADFTIFSTSGIKHINTLDGGILSCKSLEDHKEAKLMRWYHIDRDGPRQDFRCELDVVSAGTKWHMIDPNAVVGIEQLKHVDSVLEKHRTNALFYENNITSDLIQKPKADPNSSWWLYTIRVPGSQRGFFMNYMQNEWRIQVSRVHERNDIHSVYKDFRCNLPGVDEFTSKMCAIPVHWKLTEKEREKIVGAVNMFANKFSMGL